jgi:hypothetical protein
MEIVALHRQCFRSGIEVSLLARLGGTLTKQQWRANLGWRSG